MKGMRTIVSVRLDADLERQLDQACTQSGQTRSEVVRNALKRHLSLLRFEQLRRRMMPFAEQRGFLTDADVFRNTS